MVDCAIAVCAATTNKRATNNPEKTLIFFTVFYPPFFLFKQKKRPAAPKRGAQLDVVVFRIFAAQLCAARQFCNSDAGGSQDLL
jgi:hypothetical protein